ncbi:hypothetical protein T4D_8144 [Trichinella pseudospiralis]|uniref:Uncharacterized protein n=1 Tax=Trichinella pseudospiralis TaxID=6337 RepID=A0A0V1F7R2_TRIPS|nr:hypothetical protein T4D_8144 [Trichinella pseudospiralis]
MENITVVVKRQPLALCIANAKPTNSIIFGFQNITTKMLNTRIHNFDPILLLKFKNYHCMNSERKILNFTANPKLKYKKKALIVKIAVPYSGVRH